MHCAYSVHYNYCILMRLVSGLWSFVAYRPDALPARRLYILCWSEFSRRKLSPTLATPTTLVLTTLVA